MTRYIRIHIEIEGIHHWASCDEKEVNYLVAPHRHIFHIDAIKEVTHNDRDIEFIKMEHEIKGDLEAEFFDREKQLCDFGSASCEDIAEMLIKNYDLRSCEVLEDGKSGAIIIAERLV